MTTADVTVHSDTIAQVEKHLPMTEIYGISKQNTLRCHVHSREMYEHMYRRSLHDADNFWREQAYGNLRWLHNFTKVTTGSLKDGDVCWFLNGKLSVCDNCVDRWAEQFPDRVAIIWEGDDPKDQLKVTYSQLLQNVCRMANMLMRLGVRKFDTVGIYMPMIPEAVYAMLACARLGAIHSVIFAGFSAPNLRDRLLDAQCKLIITADAGVRGGRIIPLKPVVDEALAHCPNVTTCVVFKHKGVPINWVAGRDVDGREVMEGCRPYCPVEEMDSEDLLFMLYTSGSTGKPKGIAHSSAGYLLFAAITFKYVFDYHPGEVYACVADIGWITGHSYIVYGPLCNGATTVMFESLPTYPDPGRYWALVERHRINQFYTAPTALRTLMRFGDQWPAKYDLSSLRVLGSVGEPINPEAWRWYHKVIGQGRCDIVDTYWQTETGGHIVTPLPGAVQTKPGSATLPFFGVEPIILDPKSGHELVGNNVHGVLCIKRPWPGMLRTIYGDHRRMVETYMKPYPGYYFTGDGAVRDMDGYIWITGRVDDTINVSGHRVGSAEIEHALVQHPHVAEAAVVGFPHDVKGSGLFCYVTLKDDNLAEAIRDEEGIVNQLKALVRKDIGPIATPDIILLTSALPKTRSGKIMRRILRKIASRETAPGSLGDVSTLADPAVVDELIAKAEKLYISKGMAKPMAAAL